MNSGSKTSNIFFRPKAHRDYEDSDGEDDGDNLDDNNDVRVNAADDSLLFIYQAKWQKRLLSRYGNELALLDATYRTTRYALSLFFLVVKTNVDYQIVATFVCEGESTDNIREALKIIKSWNPSFKPVFFMTDYSNEEIAAIESTFEGITY